MVVMLCMAGCTQRAEEAPSPPPVQFQSVAADATSHGRRLALVLGCIGCHGDDLTGEDWSEPGFGRLWTANLTRSVPRYSDAQLADVIRGGRRPDRALWEMPSHLFTQLTAADMAALIAFLRSRPPTGAERPAPSFEAEAREEIAAGTFTSSRAQVIEAGARWPPDAGADHALGRPARTARSRGTSSAAA